MKKVLITILLILCLTTTGNVSFSQTPRGVPFGEFATPPDGETVRSSIAVTGWALDNKGVESVKIYRESEDGHTLVYIGDGVFVEGARPDVEQAYPGYPNNSAAGWGVT